MSKTVFKNKKLILVAIAFLSIATIVGWNYFISPIGKVKLSSYIPNHSIYCLANGPQCGCPEGGQVFKNECYVDRETAEKLIESF